MTRVPSRVCPGRWLGDVKPPYQCALKVKSRLLVSPAATVIFWVMVPSFSCQACTVYSPGGRFGKWKLPTLPVTAKYGCLKTATSLFIQGCTLHFTGMAISSRGKLSSMVEPAGSALFHSRLLAGRGCTLCVVLSLFTILSFWLARSATTWGAYSHPFCSKVTTSAGTSKLRFSNPLEMNTITLPSELSLPVTKSWLIAGPGWALAQLGSEFMLIFVGWGSCPVNFTLPTTDAPDPDGGFPAPEAPLAAEDATLASARTAPAIIADFLFKFMRVDSSCCAGVVISGADYNCVCGRLRGRVFFEIPPPPEGNALLLADRVQLRAFLGKVITFLVAVGVCLAINRKIRIRRRETTRLAVVLGLAQLKGLGRSPVLRSVHDAVAIGGDFHRICFGELAGTRFRQRLKSPLVTDDEGGAVLIAGPATGSQMSLPSRRDVHVRLVHAVPKGGVRLIQISQPPPSVNARPQGKAHAQNRSQCNSGLLLHSAFSAHNSSCELLRPTRDSQLHAW